MRTRILIISFDMDHLFFSRWLAFISGFEHLVRSRTGLEHGFFPINFRIYHTFPTYMAWPLINLAFPGLQAPKLQHKNIDCGLISTFLLRPLVCVIHYNCSTSHCQISTDQINRNLKLSYCTSPFPRLQSQPRKSILIQQHMNMILVSEKILNNS